MGDGDLIRLALLDSFPVRGGAVRYVKEEVAGRIRGRVDRSPGTTPPRRAASSPVAGQGACCLGGFDPQGLRSGPLMLRAHTAHKRDRIYMTPLNSSIVQFGGGKRGSSVHVERRHAPASVFLGMADVPFFTLRYHTCLSE